MPTDSNMSPAHDEARPPEDVPAIEDANFGEGLLGPPVEEDDVQSAGVAGRSLGPDAVIASQEPDEILPSSSPPAPVASDQLAVEDVTTLPDEPLPDAVEPSTAEPPDWDLETSTHRIVIELKRIESEVRTILENRDSRRKRKLGGSRRWLELEEDIITWRYSGRFDEPTLRHLQELVAKRNYLFRRLRFIAGTRPTWNT